MATDSFQAAGKCTKVNKVHVGRQDNETKHLYLLYNLTVSVDHAG